MSRTKRRFGLAVAVLGLAAGGAGRAKAEPITYTIEGTVSGSLNGTPFTDQSITITTAADTNNVTSPSPGFYEVVAPAPTIDVSGFAPVTLSDTVYVYDNQGGIAGVFGTVDPEDILDTAANAFTTYDLKSSIGPVSGTPIYNGGDPFSTSGGDLVIDTVAAVSFQATPAAAGVPEPATVVSAGLAVLMGLAYARLRRRTSAA